MFYFTLYPIHSRVGRGNLIIIRKYLFLFYEASRDAEAQSVTVNATGCGFDLRSRKRNLYFHFFALVTRQKRGVQFHHSTRNASKFRRKATEWMF